MKPMLWYSLEASNKYAQHRFSWENNKKYYVDSGYPLLSGAMFYVVSKRKERGAEALPCSRLEERVK